ncbi:MAG: hypothetical protein V4649_10185 [Bacteroidota bacterium]
MKKQLFFLVCLICSLAADAQVEVGVNAGGMLWRRTFKKEDPHYDVHGTGALTAAYNLRFLKVGIGYSRSVLTYTSTFGTLDDHLFYRADPLNEFSLFAAYQHHKYRTDNYIGVSGSYLTYKSRYDGGPFGGITASGNGLSYGIIAGSTYRLFKGFCLNMQIGACRANTDHDNFWYFPFTGGIHYKLFDYDKSKKTKVKIYLEDFNDGRPKRRE